ncbi:hypothetical protein YC2023_042363 [Brassica napus]
MAMTEGDVDIEGDKTLIEISPVAAGDLPLSPKAGLPLSTEPVGVRSLKILKRSQDVLEHREGVVEVAEKVVATGKEAVLDLIQELENTKAISSGGNITGRVSESGGNGMEVMNGEEISKVGVENNGKMQFIEVEVVPPLKTK